MSTSSMQYDPNVYNQETDGRMPPDAMFGEGWTVVYPVIIRAVVNDSKTVKYSDSVVHVASSVDFAEEWCKSNTDLSAHDTTQGWWWFVVMQEAIDGCCSGVGGVVKMLDWDAKPITKQPLKGYNVVVNDDDEGEKCQ